MFEKKMDALMPGRGRAGPQRRLGRAVHGEDQIETVIVRRLHLARTLLGDVDAVAGSCFHRSRIGPVARMPVAGPGGIHVNLSLKSRIAEALPEDAFGERRAANVAHADKQHRDAALFSAI